MFKYLFVLLCPSVMAFQGPYAGLGLGGTVFRGEYKDTGTSDTRQGNNISYGFGPLGGYLYNVQGSKSVFGGELGVLWNGNKISKSDINVSIKCRYTMNASLIAGMIMNPRTLLIGILGADWHSISLNTSAGVRSKTTNAFAPGVGVMYKVSQNVLGGVRCIYSQGKKMTGASPAQSYTPKEFRIIGHVSYLF